MTTTDRFALFAFVLAACGGAGAGDRTTLSSIPQPAAAALTAQAGAAPIQHVSREIAGDRELYEASWSEGGLEREAKVTAAGELVELEIEVRDDDVPEPVRTAAQRTLAGAATIKYMRLGDGLYEAESTIAGRLRDVTLTASGEPAKDDDDDDDDDD